MNGRLALAERYVTTQPDDVARHIEGLDAADATALLSALPATTAGRLLPHLTPHHASRIVSDLPARDATAIVAAMEVDGAAALLRRMTPDVVARVLGALPPDQARSVGALLAYGPSTAGGVMDPMVLTVPAAVTVADARTLLEAHPMHLYYYVYVVDAEQRLAGVFDLAELMQAQPHAPVRTILAPNVSWLSADAPLESVFAHPAWRTFDALPVLDADRRFLGVLRHRRMRELREQDATTSGDDRAVQAVMALGEIYWLGLCGLLQGIASTAAESKPGDAA